MSFSAAELCATPPETPERRKDTRSNNIMTQQQKSVGAEPSSGAAGLDTSVLGQLNSKEAKTLLDTVDALRALHVGDIVHLPQIVVVGDQSAGKSSVLEAISRVRFPTKGGLCTRFATELILRRADFSSASVRIVRASPQTRDDDAGRPFERLGFITEDLPGVIEEAKAWMGLDEDGAGDFSRDVLRVEVSGPDVHPLTLVDLPGFFQSPVQGQSAQGKLLVDQLAESYMKQKNSIMLAVVSANYQVTNQRVLREVKKHDPEMKRTLGIVTKPDLPQPGSDDQRQAIQLASGQDALNTLPLGWHVLRNRSEFEGDIAGSDRDAQEEGFFRSGNWSVIPRKDRGAAMLRTKLSRVLLDHIQRSLPGLIDDIEANLTTREHELARLGKERSQPEDMRGFLVEIAVQFERLVRDAVNGHYGDDFFGELQDEEKKLRSWLRNLNRAFGKTLLKKGSAETIVWADDEFDVGKSASDAEDEDEDDESEANDVESSEVARFQQTGGSRIDVGARMLSSLGGDSAERAEYYLRRYLRLYKFPKPVSIQESEMKYRVEGLASVNQGREFPGSVNPDLALDLFKAQSAPWEGIARFHIKLVSGYCISFVEGLFQHIIGPDTETLNAILRLRVDTWFQEKSAALEQRLQELLRPYKVGYGASLEQEMQTRTDTKTIRRLVKQVEKLFKAKGISDEDDFNTMDILSGLNSDGSPVTSRFGTEKIIDLMMAHYEMSLRTFTENIINLAVESCLVGSLQTILTPQAVNRMSDEELDELAGESDDVKTTREGLKRQVAVLKDGLRKCQRYRPRQMTAVPSISTKLRTKGQKEPVKISVVQLSQDVSDDETAKDHVIVSPTETLGIRFDSLRLRD